MYIMFINSKFAWIWKLEMAGGLPPDSGRPEFRNLTSTGGGRRSGLVCLRRPGNDKSGSRGAFSSTMAATQDRGLGIYIKGIDEDTSELDCRAAFSPFGLITEVFLKSERGFALVHFSSAAEALAAATGEVTTVGGAAVEVTARTPAKEAKEILASNNLYLRGLDEETTQEEIREALAAFGAVTSVKLQAARGFAYAAMDSMEQAAAVVAASPLTVGELADVACEMRRSRAPTRKPRAKKEKEQTPPRDLSKDIYIKGLKPESAENSNEDDLIETFGAYGTIDRVMLRRDRDFAFITFVEDGAVAMAVAASDGITINGESVSVEARNPRERTER